MSQKLWIPFTVPGTEAAVTVRAGRGSTVITVNGDEILDFAGGLWNVGFGYDDAGLADAMRAQIDRLMYYPTFRDMASEVAVELAEELAALSGIGNPKVVLTTGGGSAVEAALKLSHLARPGGVCVSLAGSYHGTMYGGSAVSGQELWQQQTRAQFDWTRTVPVNDIESFRELARREQISCVIVEPVVGNGCVPLLPEFIAAVGAECRRQNAVLIADEVATGFGRTGPLLASAGWSVRPDITLVSKLLTGGAAPLAALLVAPSVWHTFKSNGLALPHGETQGGNPIACAAALSVVRRWQSPAFVTEITQRARGFERWANERAWGPGAVQGRGFMQAVTVSQSGVLPSASVEQRAAIVAPMLLAAGLRVYGGGDQLCLFPPLTVSDDELETAGRIIDSTWKMLI